MEATNSLFFLGDDFNATLGILEEELDKQFKEAADEVSIRFFLSRPESSEKQCFDIHLSARSSIIAAAFL